MSSPVISLTEDQPTMHNDLQIGVSSVHKDRACIVWVKENGQSSRVHCSQGETITIDGQSWWVQHIGADEGLEVQLQLVS